MTNPRKSLRSNSSGQLLLVAALAIALLISSTTIYVYELSSEKDAADSSPIDDFIPAVKQSVANTMVGSLANISNGGDKAVLRNNLNTLSEAVLSLRQFGISQVDFALLNDSSYDSGVLLSWDSEGIGISSVYADLTVRNCGAATNITTSYPVNVTTTLTVSGSFTRPALDQILVNLTCQVYNEGEPALFRNASIFYENLGFWIPVDSSNNISWMDYGNGTYASSFTLNVLPFIPISSLRVLVSVYDTREILVKASATCYEA